MTERLPRSSRRGPGSAPHRRTRRLPASRLVRQRANSRPISGGGAYSAPGHDSIGDRLRETWRRVRRDRPARRPVVASPGVPRRRGWPGVVRRRHGFLRSDADTRWEPCPRAHNDCRDDSGPTNPQHRKLVWPGFSFLDERGWGFGVSVLDDGRYTWDEGLGTTWSNVPSKDLTVVVLTQRAADETGLPAVCEDVLNAAKA